MSGLLNPKTRILDTIITSEGRSQISTGRLKAEYVTFSDMGAIYSLDTIVSGGLDQTYRICFEAGNLPQDRIVFEADDSGKLLGNFMSGSVVHQVAAGQIFSGSTREERVSVSGSQFNSLSEQLLDTSINNFKNLYILSSPDPVDDRYNEFLIGPSTINFNITEERPIGPDDLKEASVDHIESLFYDKRLSHIPNFQFLPPVNKARTGEDQGSLLGLYVNLNQSPILTFSDVEQEIKALANIGFEQKIYFTETSRANNILGQFFEVSNGEMTKLDVIDFGKFPPDKDGISRQVFFVGKVFTDANGSTTYVNMFTMIWE
ncbi:MAG: hypothetical protein WC761_00685 [Candidatus Paceibacterota bacterium]|jgi:hypothetical protein